MKFDFTDQVSLLVHYIQLEEDLDVNKNNTLVNSTIIRRGEDYLSGGTLMLKPIPGLDLHLIGLYGEADQGIPVAQVEAMKAALAAANKPAEFKIYPGAPHGFHADYRPSYRKEAAEDGWKRCLVFFAKHLKA